MIGKVSLKVVELALAPECPECVEAIELIKKGV